MPGVVIIDPNDNDAGFSTGDDQANALYLDIETGDLYIADLITIYQWEGDTGIPMQYTWKSGQLRMPKKMNMGAVIVEADSYTNLTFKLSARINGVFTQITSVTVSDGEPIRLPGGYIANVYQIEVIGTDQVTGVAVAQSIFDLAAG